jgi:hypothetical protein
VPDRDTALTLLQAATGLASVLLVFAGFVFAKAEATMNARRADTYRNVARSFIAPLCLCFGAAWLSLNYALWSSPDLLMAVWMFRAGLLATVFLSAVVLFIYL